MSEDYKKVKNIGREIKPTVERELWAITAGRCEFANCNRRLFISHLTKEKVILAEKAHIYSFSEDGPRGWTGFKKPKKELNTIENLMLLCTEHHTTIDKAEKRYPASLLLDWKKKHEERIETVTGIDPKKGSHIILYGSRVGERDSPLDGHDAAQAMFPDRFPASSRPVSLSMVCEHEDNSPAFWQSEAAHLRAVFDKKVQPLIDEGDPKHLSVFALAAQPLLVLLGSLITDKNPSELYQLHREPSGWKWKKQNKKDQKIQTERPEEPVEGREVALLFSLSGKIRHDQIKELLGDHIDFWEVSFSEPVNTALKSKEQLQDFRDQTREILARIDEAYPGGTTVNIFPAMPIPCAIELGRVRMPKANHPWKIYDKNPKTNGFAETITIDPKPKNEE